MQFLVFMIVDILIHFFYQLYDSMDFKVELQSNPAFLSLGQNAVAARQK